jgi:hypothetical protein
LEKYQEGDPDTAKRYFEEGLKLWEDVLDPDKHPHIRADDLTAEETGLIINRYLDVLQQLDLPPPKVIPFEDLMLKVAANSPAAVRERERLHDLHQQRRLEENMQDQRRLLQGQSIPKE